MLAFLLAVFMFAQVPVPTQLSPVSVPAYSPGSNGYLRTEIIRQAAQSKADVEDAKNQLGKIQEEMVKRENALFAAQDELEEVKLGWGWRAQVRISWYWKWIRAAFWTWGIALILSYVLRGAVSFGWGPIGGIIAVVASGMFHVCTLFISLPMQIFDNIFFRRKIEAIKAGEAS